MDVHIGKDDEVLQIEVFSSMISRESIIQKVSGKCWILWHTEKIECWCEQMKVIPLINMNRVLCLYNRHC